MPVSALRKIIIYPSQTYDEETFHPTLLEALELAFRLIVTGLLSSLSVFVAFVIINLTEKVVAISHQSTIFG